MALKYNSLKEYGYNWLNKAKYNASYNQRLIQLMTRTGPRPIVLDKNMVQVAILENSFDVIIEQEVGGMDEISFSLSMTDPKRELIENEGYVQMFDDIYVIREIIDKKKSQTTEVYAEAIWYDLQYAEPLESFSWETVTAAEMIANALKATGWQVGTVAVTTKRSLQTSDVSQNRLEVLRKIESIFQGELWFDTQYRTVSLYDTNGFETGASVMYEKNADEIEAVYDTRELITKLYLYGKEGMTIEDANSGVPYLVNNTYTNIVRVQTIKDERYTNPFQLKEMGEKALAVLCRPRTSYTAKMGELTERQGLEHENFLIGGIVRVYDKELNLNHDTRIMKWTYNVIEPWKTQINLESKAKTLSELLTGTDGDTAYLESETSVSGEMLNLSVYNYLMNSRADDGYSYWTNEGWEIDPINGSTGGASFKAIGQIDREKTLRQTVFPSSATDYAVSFKSYTDNIVLGPGGRIGIEITIKYEDDTTEAKFITLAQEEQ